MKKFVLVVVTAFLFGIALRIAYDVGRAPTESTHFGEVAPRSGHWPKVRADFLATHTACEICGCDRGLQVHHVKAFHLYPELELEPKNFVVLCGPEGHGCHFSFGHLFDYKLSNAHIRDDIAYFKKRVDTARSAK